MLSRQLIQELQTIVTEEYGIDLELAEAAAIGNGLVDYFDLLAQIHHQDESE